MEDGTAVDNTVTLFNADKSQSQTVDVDEQGRAKTTELRDALEALYGVPDDVVDVPVNVVTVLTKNGQAFRFNSDIVDDVKMAAGMYLLVDGDKVPMDFVEPGKFTVSVTSQEIEFFFLPFTHLNNVEEGKLGATEETDGFPFGGDLAQGADAFVIWLMEDPDYTQFIITVNTNDMTYDLVTPMDGALLLPALRTRAGRKLATTMATTMASCTSMASSSSAAMRPLGMLPTGVLMTRLMTIVDLL